MKTKIDRPARKARKSTASSDAKSIPSGACSFAYADGRHCRMLRWRHHPAFCLVHAHQERQLLADLGSGLANKRTLAANAARVARELSSLSGEFKTASDVNRALGKLFSTLAQGRIPRRNALALAYVGQLLIQTLPNVRREISDTLGYDAWQEAVEAAVDERPSEPESEPPTSLE